MRRHGWQLKPELGRIIRTSGDDGRLLMEPEREPTIHHNLPPRTLQAIAMMGWGDHMRGLALMREHPGIANPPDMDAEYKVNALKQADELQRRWIECYRQAGM
jgi:hypothetical protein